MGSPPREEEIEGETGIVGLIVIGLVLSGVIEGFSLANGVVVVIARGKRYFNYTNYLSISENA